jgi:hypothetical protein
VQCNSDILLLAGGRYTGGNIGNHERLQLDLALFPTPITTVFTFCMAFADWKPSVKVYTWQNLDCPLVQWYNMAIHEYKNAKIAKIWDPQKFHLGENWSVHNMACVSHEINAKHRFCNKTALTLNQTMSRNCSTKELQPTAYNCSNPFIIYSLGNCSSSLALHQVRMRR